MRNYVYRLVAAIWVLVAILAVPSAFADGTDYSDSGAVLSNPADEYIPTYEEVMNQYDIESRVSVIGPTALLGRLYAAATYSGSSDYVVERLEIASLYDKVLAVRAWFASSEAASYERNMPDTQAYEHIWTRLDTEKKVLEKYPFVRMFRQSFEANTAVHKALVKVDAYFAEEHSVAQTEARIADMEARLRDNPPKDPVRLITLFVMKEYTKEQLELAKRSPLEGLAPDEIQGE